MAAGRPKHPSFAELDVPPVLIAALKAQGIHTPFPIQAATLPSSLAGIVEGVVGLDESAEFVGTDHVADAPPVAQRRRVPCLGRQAVEVCGQRLALGVDGGPDVGCHVCLHCSGCTPAFYLMRGSSR